MQMKLSIKILSLAFLLHAQNALTAPAVCGDADPLLPEVYLNLIGTEKSKNNDFIGTFELKNNLMKPAIFIPVESSGKDNFIEYPSATLEFLDLNGSWVQLLNHPPGTYIPSKNFLKVEVNSKAIFKAKLFSKDLPGLGGTDFRLLLRLTKPKTCIPSYTFTALPGRPPATSIESKKDKQQNK